MNEEAQQEEKKTTWRVELEHIIHECQEKERVSQKGRDKKNE